MAAAIPLVNYNDFFSHYTQAKSKEEEAVAILEILQEAKQEQAQETAAKKQAILKEINAQEFVTKSDLQTVKGELMAEISNSESRLRLEFHREISKAKWHLLGGALVLVVIPILLKHVGV